MPERASRAWLCRAPKSSLEKEMEVLVPGPFSRFYVSTFLEAPYIYDPEDKAVAKQQRVIITV